MFSIFILVPSDLRAEVVDRHGGVNQGRVLASRRWQRAVVPCRGSWLGDGVGAAIVAANGHALGVKELIGRRTAG